MAKCSQKMWDDISWLRMNVSQIVVTAIRLIAISNEPGELPGDRLLAPVVWGDSNWSFLLRFGSAAPSKRLRFAMAHADKTAAPLVQANEAFFTDPYPSDGQVAATLTALPD